MLPDTPAHTTPAGMHQSLAASLPHTGIAFHTLQYRKTRPVVYPYHMQLPVHTHTAAATVSSQAGSPTALTLGQTQNGPLKSPAWVAGKGYSTKT